MATALVVAMVFALRALSNDGVPKGVGLPPPGGRFITRLAGALGVTVVLIPVFAWLVSNRAIARDVLYTVGASALAYILLQAFRVTRRERERLLLS